MVLAALRKARCSLKWMPRRACLFLQARACHAVAARNKRALARHRARRRCARRSPFQRHADFCRGVPPPPRAPACCLFCRYSRYAHTSLHAPSQRRAMAQHVIRMLYAAAMPAEVSSQQTATPPF
jgi:hypothetical protein